MNIKTLVLVLLGTWSLIPMCEVQAAARPNIVFILTDDQAPWALGLSGHPHARTPVLDRLFRQGAWLKNCFTTTPVCSPSRAALMTGHYGTELGITDWLHPRREAEHGLQPGTQTWPRRLQQAGYRTALVGKWHLGLQDRHHPSRFGYEHFYGFRSGGNRPTNAVLEVGGRERRVPGLLPEVLVDESIRWMTEDDERPFLLSLHFRAPHSPWLPVAQEDWAPFENLDPKLPHPDFPGLNVSRVKKMTREYLASMKSVDRNVGRLLDTLQKHGLSQKTVVIFSSDHGYNMGHNGIWHKGNGHWVLKSPPAATRRVPRGQRPNMYDHSLRVPTAVRWPGVIAPGTVITQTVTNLDFYPTILALADVVATGHRGRNFLPLLKGEQVEWSNDLFAQYDTRHQSRTSMRAWRTSGWKLVRDFLDPARNELYDLAADPEETSNLIGLDNQRTRKVLGQLNRRLLQEMRRIDDPALFLLPGENPVQAVGHRGLPERLPENTLAGFEACLALKVGCEIDVQRTIDGHIVCLHDATLNRTTNGKGALAKVRLAELQQLDAGSWFHPEFRDQRVPTLEALLSSLSRDRGGHTLVAVDLKGDDSNIEKDIVVAAQSRGVLQRLLFIGRAIRNPDVRRRLRRASPETHVCCLANDMSGVAAAIADDTSDWVYIRFVPTSDVIADIHRAGKRVFQAGPTVARRQAVNWKTAAQTGVDAVLTDFPLELRTTIAPLTGRTGK